VVLEQGEGDAGKLPGKDHQGLNSGEAAVEIQTGNSRSNRIGVLQ
jgi:hypothetical protein